MARAIQTWASVDSVEASRGRGVGTLRDDLDRDGDLEFGDALAAKANPPSLPALPETLSPITQVAEPPVRVALETIQPALAGGADRLDDVASRPRWSNADSRRRLHRRRASARDSRATRERSSRPANGPANGPVGAVAGKFHSFRTDAEATLELEVAKRRARPARSDR